MHISVITWKINLANYLKGSIIDNLVELLI